MKILGIETSCDETAAAVIENGNTILSNIVASSIDIHIKTGGIVPENAARQQIKSIIPVITGSLTTAKCNIEEIDAIAVTIGPGLIGSLLVGVEAAKTLSFFWDKPIIPVNHLTAHIYANFIRNVPNSDYHKSFSSPLFPLLALVVSGGHTDLVFMKRHGKLKWIGGTRDDAAGEAFDKTARLLGLPYPGGPSISKAAEKYLRSQLNKKQSLRLFPRPIINENNYDWSFSGLKTSALRKVTEIKNNKGISKKEIAKLSAEVQEAIVDVLVVKTLKAVDEYNPKSFLLAGGVAANLRLREKFTEEITNNYKDLQFHVPQVSLCTDNAAYIASFGFFNNHPISWKKIDANPQLTIGQH